MCITTQWSFVIESIVMFYLEYIVMNIGRIVLLDILLILSLKLIKLQVLL